MPMGLVSDESLELELNRNVVPSNPKVTIEPLPSSGRNKGDVNVPESLRKIIGETSVIDGRQSALQIAKEFGISPASVSAYAKGSTSTSSYHAPEESIVSHITKSRHRAIKRASKTLNGALGAITQEKLDYADASDLSGIAKDMSVIIKNLEPPQVTATDGSQPIPQFVIYAPQFRDERTFESIVVNE
jgi:predicted transcriptional regulator